MASDRPKILVYGAEQKGMHAGPQIERPGFSLEFEGRRGSKRFDEFDGVITFNGVFETFSTVRGIEVSIQHSVDEDDLDRRSNETRILLENGGFLCCLLTDPIIDSIKHKDCSTTDLTKRILIAARIRGEDLGSRYPIVKARADELREFFSRFGAARTALQFGPNANCHVLGTLGDSSRVVSAVANGSVFFIPALIPSSNDEEFLSFFDSLVSGILTLHTKLAAELPQWTSQFQFTEERRLRKEAENLKNRLKMVTDRISSLSRFKRALVASGAPLVETVIEIFSKGLGIEVERIEEFKEDLRLVDGGEIFALCEVKGTKRSLSREHVNQTDSHRERSGYDPSFPAILIINTHSAADSLAGKDLNLPSEQVAHAARLNVLVMRTLDLLRLADLLDRQLVESSEMRSLIKTSAGWLRVEEDGYDLISA